MSPIPDDVREANRARARELVAQAPAELNPRLREVLNLVFMPKYRELLQRRAEQRDTA